MSDVFGRTKTPRPTVEQLREQPSTVTGWSTGDLRAAVAWPPPGTRRTPSPLVLLDHADGCAVLPLRDLVDLDAGREGIAESAAGYPTSFVAHRAAIATSSAAADVTRDLPADSVVVVADDGRGLRRTGVLTPTGLAELATWAADTAAAGGPR